MLLLLLSCSQPWTSFPQVNKIAIQYAKTAKKMDMKRLKKSMWDILTNGEKKETVAEVSAGGARYLNRPGTVLNPCRDSLGQV